MIVPIPINVKKEDTEVAATEEADMKDVHKSATSAQKKVTSQETARMEEEIAAGIAGNLVTSHMSVPNQEEEVATEVEEEVVAEEEDKSVESMKGEIVTLETGVGFRMMLIAIGEAEVEVAEEVEDVEIGREVEVEVEVAEEVEDTEIGREVLEVEVEEAIGKEVQVDQVVIAEMEIVVDVDECFG